MVLARVDREIGSEKFSIVRKVTFVGRAGSLGFSEVRPSVREPFSIEVCVLFRDINAVHRDRDYFLGKFYPTENPMADCSLAPKDLS